MNDPVKFEGEDKQSNSDHESEYKPATDALDECDPGLEPADINDLPDGHHLIERQANNNLRDSSNHSQPSKTPANKDEDSKE